MIAKNGKEAKQPIPAIVVELLTALKADIKPNNTDRVFSFYMGINTAKLIRDDLKKAEISLTDKDGNEICFHSLRNSYISFLANSSTPAKVVQKLARHSDPRLTFNTYARTFDESEQKAINFLPNFGGFVLSNCLDSRCIKDEICRDTQKQKIGHNTDKMALMAESLIAPRGFEPLVPVSESSIDKELTQNVNPVLSIDLDKVLQNYPELASVIAAWPNLPEHIKTTICTLVKNTRKSETT